MRLDIFPALLLTGLMLAGSGEAQTSGDSARCNINSDPAIVIRSCTAVINANPTRHDQVSLALSNRAVAYEKLGQNDRAMADLDEAIKQDSTSSTEIRRAQS